LFNGLQNIDIRPAPAKIPRKILLNLLLRRVCVFFQKRHRRKHKPRRAIGTLKPGLLDEGLLNGMQIAILGKPFNGLDVMPHRLNGQHQATADQLAVEQHRTRPAHADSTPLLRADQVQFLPQDGKERPGIAFDGVGLVVDG